MHCGTISVLYIKKKDRSDPRNYRPITLLNNDYKFLMRILTLLDIEKAFDRCSWEFLQDALAAIGFGQDFIDYVLL